jgi:hypothetical protein
MKTLKTFIPAIILLGLTLVWHACTKKDDVNSRDFFQKDDLSFFKSLNGELARVDFLDKTVDRFKILNQRQHFIPNLEAKYGAAKWDMTMVVRNKDGLYTLITPFIDFKDSVKALLFSYHSSNTKTVYTIYNSENYRSFFDYSGDNNAKTINRSTVEGLFREFGNKNQLFKSIREGKTQPRAIIISWVCWYYTWQYGTDGVGVSNEQCSYSIHDTGGGGGGTPSGGDAGGVTIDQDQPENPDDRGGGTTETWTYEEKPSPNQNIIDSLQGYPCGQNILGAMPDLNTFTDSLLNKIFGVNDNVNIIFRAQNGMPNFINGYTDPAARDNDGKLNIRVSLNPNVLQNSSQEFILSVMLHESIHAYYIYQFDRYVNGEVDSNFVKMNFPKIWQYHREWDDEVGHQEMATGLAANIASSLAYFNKELPSGIALALSYQGLANTPAWVELGQDTTSVKNAILLAKYGNATEVEQYKMHKCQNN